MVLTPRVCCWTGATIALADLETAGRVTGAVMKLRFGMAGAATFCLEALRAVRANVFEAILDREDMLTNRNVCVGVCVQVSQRSKRDDDLGNNF